MKTRESTTTPRGCERDTCVKSSVVRGPGPVVRRCSYHCQIQRPDDPLQCTDQRPPHPHQFAVSCPTYLCAYAPIYIRCIAFAWHLYIPEHYHCFLRRDLRDVDLHRPSTRRRRRVELPNPVVHIPSVALYVGPSNRPRHRHRVKTQFELHGPRRLLFPTYPKRKQCLLPVLNPKLQTPSSPKHPGTDAREDPHHQSRAKLRLSMLTKPSFRRATKPNTTHLSHTG